VVAARGTNTGFDGTRRVYEQEEVDKLLAAARSEVDLPTIEEMKAELIAAGWRPKPSNSTIWKSPHGILFRGPYGAWRVMKGLGNWNSSGNRKREASDGD
jgi:hypothetical protein